MQADVKSVESFTVTRKGKEREKTKIDNTITNYPSEKDNFPGHFKTQVWSHF